MDIIWILITLTIISAIIDLYFLFYTLKRPAYENLKRIENSINSCNCFIHTQIKDKPLNNFYKLLIDENILNYSKCLHSNQNALDLYCFTMNYNYGLIYDYILN